MSGVSDLADEFLRRFDPLGPAVVYRGDEAVVCSLKLHSRLRGLRRPISVFLSTYEDVARAYTRDPDWLDGTINDALAGNEGRSELMLFVLAPPGTPKAAEDALATQVLAQQQPIIPVSAIPRRRAPADAICDVILRFSQTRQFNPYRIDHVAPETMFFGRKHLLNSLRSTRGSKVIVGPRRIGKTSLGQRLQQLLGHFPHYSDSRPVRRCAYVDVAKLGSDASARIWKSILEGFNLRLRDYQAAGRIILPGSNPRDYRKAIIDEAQALGSFIDNNPGQFTIILDEVDRWVETEAADGWPGLDRLRAMCDEGKAQVLLIGYESLSLAADNDRFPFAGRGNKQRIGPLERPDVDDLVTQPLAELGLELDGKEPILNRIWTASSGMPHIVQDICSLLIDLAFQSNPPSKRLTVAMLTTAIQSAATVRNLSQGVINAPLPLAEAIAGVLSIAAAGDSDGQGKETRALKNSDIAELLEQGGYRYDARDFERALAYLELRYVIQSIDAARSWWEPTNLIARDNMRQYIVNTDQRRWMSNVLERHDEGRWRDRYLLLESGEART